MVSRIPIGRTGRPEEVAALVHFLVSAEASFTTGQCYDISGGRATLLIRQRTMKESEVGQAFQPDRPAQFRINWAAHVSLERLNLRWCAVELNGKW